MRIEILKCLQDNYSYLIIDETNKNACVVDPGESIPIINFVENNNLKLKAQLFSDLGDDNFEFELTGKDVDAYYIGKAVGEKLLILAGEKFKKK